MVGLEAAPIAWDDGFGHDREVPTSRRGYCPSYDPFGARPLFLTVNEPCTSMKEALMNKNTRYLGLLISCLASPPVLVCFSSTECFMR
jgi:hypothetical protein